jgi:membrane carboxypeptidase/penicillin-binding protein
MARRTQVSIEQLIGHFQNLDRTTITREENRLAETLSSIHGIMRAAGMSPAWSLTRSGSAARSSAPASKSPAAARAPKSKRRRAVKGKGWETLEAAMKSSGGTGTSASLKDAWAKFGGKTPLSVALASYVNSGRLKRKGKGRDTVFTLA